MPRAYGVPTDASGSERLPWSWAVEQLTAARNYWICTTRRDGRPHAMPVWEIWQGGAVWFSTDPSSAKGRNMARDPRVVVHLESGDDTVVLEGKVEHATDRECARAFRRGIRAKVRAPDRARRGELRHLPAPAARCAYLDREGLSRHRRALGVRLGVALRLPVGDSDTDDAHQHHRRHSQDARSPVDRMTTAEARKPDDR